MARRSRYSYEPEEVSPSNAVYTAQFRETVDKVVSMLTERGMSVTQKGINAYVQYDSVTGLPKLVNIPAIHDGATEEYLSAIRGFIDHECAHVLFSDGRAMIDAVKNEPQIQMPLNILEDVMIERRMIERFPGAAKHIATTWEFVLEHQTLPYFRGAKTQSQRYGALLPALIHAWSGKREAVEFFDRNNLWSEAQPLIDKLEPLRARIASDWTGTTDSLTIANDLLGLLREMMDTSAPSKSEGQESDSDESSEDGDGQESSPSKSSKSGEKKDDKPGKSDGDKSDEKDDKGDKSDGDDKKDGDKSDKSDGDGKGDNKKPDEKDGKKSSGSKSDDKGEESGKESSASGEEGKSEGDKKDTAEAKPAKSSADIMGSEGLSKLLEDIQDFENQMSDTIRKLAISGTKEGDYIAYTRDYDQFVKPIPDAKHELAAQQKIAEIEKSTLVMTGQLSNQFRRLFAAQEQVLNVGGMRSGRLQANALHRLATNDDRVFYRREEHTSLDTAVSLVIDCSGSMQDDNKIGLALIAAYAFSSTLERVGITHEVIGFTTRHDRCMDYDELGKMGEEQVELNRGFSRWDPIRMLEFKNFEERLRATRVRFGAMSLRNGLPYPLYSNVDGESVLYAAERLLKRRETRKVMVVFSDGMPAAGGNLRHLNQHLKTVIKELTEKAKLDILGIGIKSSDVQQFYPKNVVLHKAEDLPQTVMKEITQLLLKQRR